MILAIDPSSTRVGYALMHSANHLAEAGLLKPGKSSDAAIVRIASFGRDLAALITEAKPTEIVIEITSGKVARRGRQRGMNGAGLGVYGMAVGYLWRTCEVLLPEGVTTLEENVWTRGVSKADRSTLIASAFRQYKPTTDPGGDVADAIGLGRWYMNALQPGRMRQRVRRDGADNVTYVPGG
jgi:hypothetical protein